jgi:hypothetical protein
LYIDWNGNQYINDASGLAIHTIMFGFVVDGIARYNKIYSLGSGYGIIFKSAGTNDYTTGGAFYNLISGCLVAVRVRDVEGVKVCNNTISCPGSTYAAILITGTTYPAINTIVKNNIIEMSGNKACISTETESLGGMDSDYNNYYPTGGGGIGAVSASTYATLAEWQAIGQDAHSVYGNPLFINAWHLQASSPAINAGVSLNLTPDMDGIAVSNPPEMGCYEYI